MPDPVTMRAFLRVLLPFAVVLAWSAFQARAQQAAPTTKEEEEARYDELKALYDAKGDLWSLALNPLRFFGGFRPDLEITYHGDDYDEPVYALAALNRKVRLVRGSDPGAPENWVGPPRPRWRGAALTKSLAAGRIAQPEADPSRLMDSLKIDWLEADIDGCPQAAALLGEAAAPFGVVLKDGPQGFELHADRIKIKSQTIAGVFVYSGVPTEGSPGGWAERFLLALEPCWRPSTATPPWRE